MHEMCYMRIKTVLIVTLVTFALILMSSVNGNALGIRSKIILNIR